MVSSQKNKMALKYMKRCSISLKRKTPLNPYVISFPAYQTGKHRSFRDPGWWSCRKQTHSLPDSVSRKCSNSDEGKSNKVHTHLFKQLYF